MSTSADEHPKANQLAQRIAQTTSRSIPDARDALRALDASQIDRLASLDDVDFLKECVKLINQAPKGQRRSASIAKAETPASSVEAKPPQRRLVLPKPDSAPAATPPAAAPAASIKLPEMPTKPASRTTSTAKKFSVPATPTPTPDVAPKATVSLADVAGRGKMSSKISSAVLETRAPLAVDAPPPEAAQAQIFDFNEHTRQINMAFQAQKSAEEEKPKLDQKSKLLLAALGITASLILILLLILAVLFVTREKVEPPPPPERIVWTKPAESVLEQHPWGYEVSGSFEQTISRDGLFSENNQGLTIELWIKVSDPAKVEQIYLRNAEHQVQFELGCEKSERGQLRAYFMVPRATEGKPRKADAAYPDSTDWVHLAGMYDPQRDNGVRLYLNGQYAAYKKTAGTPPQISSIAYVLGAKISEGATVTFDELRIASGVSYSKSFTPERLFTVQADTTRSLLHFDQLAETATQDATVRKKDLALIGGTFVATGPTTPVEAEVPAEVPDELYDAVGTVWSVAHADKFRNDWPSFSDSEKRLYWCGFITDRWPRKDR